MDESCCAAFSTTLNEMNERNITDTEKNICEPIQGMPTAVLQFAGTRPLRSVVANTSRKDFKGHKGAGSNRGELGCILLPPAAAQGQVITCCTCN